ncbi:magnesium transporter [Pigmentiphaga sp.]|uniref:magnesium transporter n=1 Tax=Pigmentiphaga sp. TaxID=1977564 RepID=UPI00128C3B3D|nr:magnesium transporter [Pigmentiphaga sp.]MPS29101.1 magnesium transporter [Alcaligenaceae bacterium SAGV5]MPS54581.1 magnesium transporter [Alcaligenaceae bacterium SAGV3]MPT55131.1 magnesium transporter [Alcaligenaceae bacterium]
MVEQATHPKSLERNRLEPEDAQEALEHVQELLRRQHLVEELVHRQEAGDSRAPLVEALVHRQHDAELGALLEDLHPADIAFILESLPKEDRQAVWQLVRPERAGEILLEVADWVRESLISTMDQEELVAATENLEADELADLAPDLPPEVVAEVQKGLTDEERARLTEVMSYPEDSVGAIMDFEMVRVRNDVTLEVVLRYLRRLQELPDHTDQIFVVDRHDKLMGSLAINRLIVSDPETQVVDVMETEILTLAPLDEADEAAAAFERYDLVSAPVVDAVGRLIGRVTVNEVVDVIREASDEQALSKAGLQEEDIFAPIHQAIRNRAPWLLVNLCTASTAAFVASRFEDTVGHIVILAFLMSIVAGIGGNSGNQTMTLIIRALAVGRINAANVGKLVRRELEIALTVGLGGGAVAALFAWAISGRYSLGLVMMAAMVLNLLVGACIGMLVPLTRSRFGKDPAIGSSVLLTFATDTMGFFIFLGLATLFLL